MSRVVHSLVLLSVALVTVATVGASVARGASEAAVLVRVRPGAAAGTSLVLGYAGATLVSRDLSLWRVPAATARAALLKLRDSDSVVFAERESTYGASVHTAAVSDPLAAQEWWRQAIGVDGLVPPGPGVPVTLVDSGVDFQHPEFVGRPDLVPLNPQEPQPLGGVHGTAVASVIGATENGVGIVGIYPQAVIRSWDAATGTGAELTSGAIANGILAASKAGRTVINLSLGGPQRDAAILAAVELAVARGSLVVAASGNEGEEGSPLSYPGALPHVLTVAATQPDGSVAPWSSASRYVDLAAPGAQIPVATVDPATGATAWAPEDGTSFASPLVSGAAAWVWSARPKLDAEQLAQILRSSASDIAPAGRDEASGYGLLNVPAALAAPTPVKDQGEPNDTVDHVTPGHVGYHGTPALTRVTKPSNRTTGRVDATEDPRDVYRIWLPKGKQVSAKLAADGAASLTLIRSTTSTVTAPIVQPDLLQRGATPSKATTLTYRNTGNARYALLVVTPVTPVTTTYTLSVSARA